MSPWGESLRIRAFAWERTIVSARVFWHCKNLWRQLNHLFPYYVRWIRFFSTNAENYRSPRLQTSAKTPCEWPIYPLWLHLVPHHGQVCPVHLPKIIKISKDHMLRTALVWYICHVGYALLCMIPLRSYRMLKSSCFYFLLLHFYSF